MGEKTQLSEGRLFINGCEAKGIPDFECTEERLNESFDKATTIVFPDGPFRFPGEATLTLNTRFNWYLFLKLIGMYDWTLENCPNKRVVHQAKYGRTIRVRNKNFRRALRIVEKEIV